MIGVTDKIGSLRQGLFAKYVFALVGLVVFVLAVNGAMETWISYRATRTTLTDAMGEKAEATARRIEQSISELERQISWVTRASAVTLEQHRADYAQLLNQVPPVNQLSLLDGNGREQLRLSRTAILVGSKADFSRDIRFTETVARGASYAPVEFRGARPFMSIAVSHSGFNAGVTVADIDLVSCRISWATPRSARPPSPMWSITAARCWRARPRARSWPRISRSCRRSKH